MLGGDLLVVVGLPDSLGGSMEDSQGVLGSHLGWDKSLGSITVLAGMSGPEVGGAFTCPSEAGSDLPGLQGEATGISRVWGAHLCGQATGGVSMGPAQGAQETGIHMSMPVSQVHRYHTWPSGVHIHAHTPCAGL